jgi:uncharacterized protein YdhG (YjbR/CyaY superfamily)
MSATWVEVGDDGAMDAAVQTYVDAIPPRTRPLFDRIDALVHERYPGVEMLITYDMPTYQVGTCRLYVAAWKNWVSFYGWNDGEDGGFVERHPELSSGQGTIKLTPKAAVDITDDEIRALIRGALDG